MRTLDNLKIPVIQGGMGVGISMGGLAGAVAKEGGMGVISTAGIGFREKDFWENSQAADRRALEKEIRKAREISGGRGLIAINAMVATTSFEEMVPFACELGIDAVISGAGLPLHLPELVKDYQVMIAPVVSSGRAAKTLLRMWKQRHGRAADFIVVEGSLAGGHLGFSREEAEEGKAQPLMEIVEEVVQEANLAAEEGYKIPVFAAGGIFDGADIRKALQAGAFGVQIGTRFIVTEECDATQEFKNVILRASHEDVRILRSPVGMPGRGLATPLVEKASEERVPPRRCIQCIKTCDPGRTPYCISRALIQAYYGNYEEGLFFCGDNVGRVSEMTTVAALMEEFAREWRKN